MKRAFPLDTHLPLIRNIHFANLNKIITSLSTLLPGLNFLPSAYASARPKI